MDFVDRIHKKETDMTKRALITGARTGIGRAVCERLIAKIYEVVGVGRRLQPLDALKQDFGESVMTVQADVGTVSGRRKISSSLKRKKLNLFCAQCSCA